jgi:hypothetical protein
MEEYMLNPAKRAVRKDFVIKDLAISVGGGGGSVFIPDDEGKTLPWWLSPIAAVTDYRDLIEGVRATVIDAAKLKNFDEVGRAFVAGGGGSPAIRAAIQDIGTAVVASAAYSALSGGRGGSAGMPDPNCAGTSMETIPPTLSPVVAVGRQVHRVTDLPRLRKQLAEAVAFTDRAAAASAPTGAEVAGVRAELEGALKSLR